MTINEITKEIRNAEAAATVAIPKGCKLVVGKRGSSRSSYFTCNICGEDSPSFSASYGATKPALQFKLDHLLSCGKN